MTFHYASAIFSNLIRATPKQVQVFMNMSKIGHLQSLLEDIFQEFTPQFVNKMHWLQLEYRTEKQKRIFVLVRIFRKNADKAVMKSAMYVFEVRDCDFLRAYLAGLVLTLAVW